MLNRRNAFQVSPEALRAEEARRVEQARDTTRHQLTPTVSRETAEIAHHLAENPVFVDLMDKLRDESFASIVSAPLGADGYTEREAGAYEIAALQKIENRLRAIAAEYSLHTPAADPFAD